jgi:hypothetical protein
MWSYFIQEGNIVLASPMDKNRIKQVFYVKITVESDLGRHGFPITQFSFCKCQKSIGLKNSTSTSRNPDITHDNSIWM